MKTNERQLFGRLGHGAFGMQVIMLVLMMLAAGVSPAWADKVIDDTEHTASHSDDHMVIKVCVCDLDSKNTWMKDATIWASNGSRSIELVQLKYINEGTDEDKTGHVKAKLLLKNAKAWFTNHSSGSGEITSSEQDFYINKWGKDNHYMTPSINFYYPAEMAGGSWYLYVLIDHSNGDSYYRTINSGVQTSTTLGLSAFDPSTFKCERTSQDNIRFTAPKLPDDISSDLQSVRMRECIYEVKYTFYKQDGSFVTYTNSYEAEKAKEKTFDFKIPTEVGNPKRIDYDITASHGVKDPERYFNHAAPNYKKTDAFNVIPVPASFNVEWRQFNKESILSWTSAKGGNFMKVTPYVYRMETDAQGNAKSGSKWSLRGKLGSTAGGSMTFTDADRNVQFGSYYRYMVLNVPTEWIDKGISSGSLSQPSDELIAGLGRALSDVMDTEPVMSIFNLQQDITETQRVRLTWQYSRVPVDATTVTFQVLRRTSKDGQWNTYGKGITADAQPAAGSVLEVIDESLPDVKARYQYMIRLSLDGGKFTFDSDPITAGLLEGSSLKAFTATKGTHSGMVKLAWEANQVGTAKSTYELWRRLVNTNDEFIKIETKSDDVERYSHDDTSVEPGQYYEYRLQVYSGGVLQNTLYDVGFCQGRGVVTGKVKFGNSGTAVEDVRMTLRPTDANNNGINNANTLKSSSQYVSGASTGIAWQAADEEFYKLFDSNKDVTIQMFLRPDSALNEEAVFTAIPGIGHLTLGKQTPQGYELNVMRMAGDIPLVKVSMLRSDYVAVTGDVLTGKMTDVHRIDIADGAIVTLKDLDISLTGSSAFPPINCLGNAIIRVEGTVNLKTSNEKYPAIYVAPNKTLTIRGSGTLNADGGGYSAGIGASMNGNCGNIVIEEGTVNAKSTGGGLGSGIGGGIMTSCGTITIKGGTVTATSPSCPGIGGGYSGNCAGITITNSIKSVTAIVISKDDKDTDCIGRRTMGSCGPVIIKGTVYWDGTNYQNGGKDILGGEILSNKKQTFITGDGAGSSQEDSTNDYIASATGLTLPWNVYSQLTVSLSGNSMKLQVGDGAVKEMDVIRRPQLNFFSVGGADGVDSLHAFKGNVAEVRVWNKVLSNAEKTAYADRILNGYESGLALYWPMDEGLNHYVFDASFINNLPNGRHATVGNNISTSTVVPAEEQLSRYATTDKNGDYIINGIPFLGAGTSYTVTPSLGIHEFYPVSASCFFNKNSTTQKNTDFEDKSSFPVRGRVTYQNTDIPVDSVQFKIDGALQSKDNKSVTTDANGYYELDVPIGNHLIECYKNGHRFTTFPKDGSKYEFKKSETVNFTDSTLVNVTGRINGGFSDYEAPVGFGQSVNRLGQATIKLSLGKESQCSFNYTVDNRGVGTYGTTTLPVASATDKINSTAYRGAGTVPDGSPAGMVDSKGTHYIYIKTDPATGEFSAMLPPLRYKVESIRFDADKGDTIYNDKPVFAQNLPVIDATNAMEERMLTDTLRTSGNLQAYKYSAKMIRQYRSNPVVTVKQRGSRNGAFGEEKIVVTKMDNTTDTVQVVNYTATGFEYPFGKAIFQQGKIYDFDIDIFETYTNLETREQFREIPTDARVYISNDASSTTTVFAESAKVGNENVEVGMTYKTMNIEAKPDSLGHVTYEWEGGWPNLADGHLRNVSVGVKIDGRTTVWKAPKSANNALDLILLGGIGSGTNFVTSGPDAVDVIIRRPPGSTSVASITNREVTSTTHNRVDTNNGYGVGGSLYLSETPSFEVSKGPTLGIALLEKSSLKMILNQTVTTDAKWSDTDGTDRTDTYSVTTEMSTPSEMQHEDDTDAFTPEAGDTYIGRSTNLLFSKGRILGLYKNATSGKYEIAEHTGITVSQDFGTSFVYPQAYILNELIPNWESIIRSRLQEGFISADHTDSLNCPKVDDKVMYYTKYTPDDAEFGRHNTDPYWTKEQYAAANGYPSYRMVNGTDDPEAKDEVEYAINQIKRWREVIAENEKDKLEAINGSGYLLDNYSFGSNSKISQTTESSTKSGISHASNYSISLNTDLTTGLLFNEAGFKISVTGTTFDGYTDTNASDTTRTTSIAWTMADADYRTALSVDVYKSPTAGWGPIFITRGGQTANPYEGATYTKFHQPGTKLNEATMQVEKPQLKVIGSTELTDVPTCTQAQFNLQMSNQTETNSVCAYVLSVKDKSNPSGAILTIDGNILSNGTEGRRIKFNPGETIYKTLIVTQSNPNVIDYEDIELVLKSENDITVASDPVKLRVHFVPSSTPVELAVNRTVINKPYIDDFNGITATMFNLDRQSDDLHGLRLRYRHKGEDTWTVLKQWTTRDSLLTQGYEMMPDGENITQKVKFDADGIYELQAQTFGKYGNAEVTFQSNTIEIIQDTHGPKILGMVSPENGQLTYITRNNMHLRFNEELNGNALSKSANFRIEGGLNNVVLDEGRPYPDVAVQLNGNSIQTEAIYDLSNSDCAFDMWFYRQGDGTIISMGTENNLLSLSTHDDGKLRARVGGEDAVFETGKTLPKDTWMYMALNYKRKTAADQDNTITMLYATANDKTPVYVGKNMPANDLDGHGKLYVGGDGMTGMVGRLSIWNNGVSADDLYLSRQNNRAAYTPGLVGYWTMDEGHGTQITDRARSRNMQMPTESWYINNENRAAHLSGKADSPLKVDISTFQPTKTDNFAYEMWFRGNEADNDSLATLMSVDNGTSKVVEVSDTTYLEIPIINKKAKLYSRFESDVTLRTDVGFDEGKLILRQDENKKTVRYDYEDGQFNGKMTLPETSNVTKVTLSEKKYLDGNWHHLALNVRRGTSAIVYIDGQAVKVLPEASVPGISSQYLTVGGTLQIDNTITNCFKGDVDEVRIWNAALDGQLISDRMYERMDNSYPGLVGYFPMEDIHRTDQGNVITEFSLDNFGEKGSRLKIVKDSIVVDNVKVPTITQAANAPALKPGSTNLLLDDTQYDFTASADEIYFSFPEGALPLMDGNDFVATISYIKDEYGNNSEAVQWRFHTNFASVDWGSSTGDYEREFVKPWNEEMDIDISIFNNTGTPQSFELSGMPSWMKVDRTVGTINGDWGYVTFHLGTDVPVGRHTEYIYLTDHLGIRRVLKFNLKVTGDEPDWTVDTDFYESNMTLTGQIYIDDKICENTDTKIAAFDNLGLCRGVASPKYVRTRDAYYVDMVIYGGASTEQSDGTSELTFKVYDASTGTIHPLVGVLIPNKSYALSMMYTPDVNYGSYDAPVVLDVANALQQKISLAKGWTWMSIYVEPLIEMLEWQLPRDKNILMRFKNIKSQVDGFANVDKDGKLGGNLEKMEPGKMYKIQLSTRTDFDLIGMALKVKDLPQTMHPGYNWIGTLSSSVMSVDEAFAELAPEPGDRVKSRTAFAEFSNKGYWEGTLESIVPGQGYIYRSKATKEKTFHYPSGKAATAQARAAANSSLFTLHSSLSHFTPVDPYLYPDNLNIIAVVKKDGQERDDAEIGAFIDGECRGAIGCNKGLYFLTVMGSSEDDSQKKMELRVWVDGEEYMVDNARPFISDAAYGTLDEPYVLDIDATAIRAVDGSYADNDADWYTLQGFKIGRKPTQPGVYIHHGQKVTIKRMK